jgi:SWI/SNF-related matrix-associated actin-dependent regulator 1 of chromatin subfamily A
MILTYINKKFILSDSPPPTKSYEKLHWLYNYATKTWQTEDINAAARFRNYADQQTEKFFNRVLLKSYPFPSGGVVSPKHLQLLPFQLEKGIPHLLNTNRTYLAHQPGLGKSAQFISLVNTKPGPALIICPAFLKNTWVREITKWSAQDFPKILVLESNDQLQTWSDGAGIDFVIVSDAMISKAWVINQLYQMKFKHVAIDEAHRFKNHLASRTTALFGGKVIEKGKTKVSSPGLIYKAEHVAALSGTPMLNRPIELWAILYSMAPETIDFMSYEQFGYSYCGPTRGEYGETLFLGAHNEKTLHAKLTAKFMQRLKKSDVLSDLPPKIRDVVLLPTNTLSAEVQKLDQELRTKIDLANVTVAGSLGEYATLRHLIGVSKIPFCANFVDCILTEDETESVILFAVHRDVVAELSTLLAKYNPCVINGGVHEEIRQRYQDEFQAGTRRLIIGNIAAMNLGLTLTMATRIVFVEYEWTPAMNEQAEDRAHRIGQNDSVYCQYLVAPNSIDELVLNSILDKEERITKIIEGGAK